MARLLIQSMNTGHFLTASPDGGEPIWVNSLREAGGGVVSDMERAAQLFEDHCEFEDQAIVIDLDRLGTKDDYPAH
jgi:hypothetical protein